MNLIEKIEKKEIFLMNKKIPYFKSGDTIIVNIKVIEGNKSRIQLFEGIVISKCNKSLNSNFIVRKISFGIGVERTFQLYSPLIKSIFVKRRGNVKRAKLYFLRKKSGKSARIKENIFYKNK